MKTPPPLSPELEALLAPHRRLLPLAPSVEARAVARAAAAAAEIPASAARRGFQRPWFVFAVAAGVVLVLRAGAYAARAWIAEPSAGGPVDVAPIARLPRPRPVVAATPEAEATAKIAPPAAPHARRAAGKTSAPPTRPTNEELQLLRAAREDVVRGDFGRAIAVITEHARRFRHGSLVEEREALRIKSLAGLGRHEEAQRAAAAFHARFPHSVFQSTFERMQEAER